MERSNMNNVNKFYQHIVSDMKKSQHDFEKMEKENKNFIARIRSDQERRNKGR